MNDDEAQDYKNVTEEEIMCVFDDNFAYFFIKNLCCGCSLDSPAEAILMSTHNIGF